MTLALELTGRLNGIVSDNEIIFPNVQTCVALVAVIHGSLVGAHLTLANRRNLSEVATKIATDHPGPITDLYVVGPVIGGPGGDYNVSSFANFGGRIHLCLTECVPHGIDVRAVIQGGAVQFFRRPTAVGNYGAGWNPIPAGQFVP